MEWADEVIQLLAAGTGSVLLLRWAGILQLKRERPPKPQGPLCVCTHGISAHESEEGPCTVEFKREFYDKKGNRNGYEWVPCPCKRYTGPRPIESLFQPLTYLPPEEKR